jgi:hypothetical protein
MSSLISFVRDTPKTRLVWKMVSGRKTAGLKPQTGTFGAMFAFVSRGTELLLRLIFELHDNHLVGHKGFACTLAKALDKF